MINQQTADLYLQLGIAGATLFILLIFVVMLFRMMGKVSTNENVTVGIKIEKLCDTINDLIKSNADHTNKLNEVLLSNDKDQKTLIEQLTRLELRSVDKFNRLFDNTNDILNRVTKIDERTNLCVGNEKGSDV